MSSRNSHCSFCGQRFPEAAPWPRTCAQCGNTSFLNPIPVAVLVVPVDDGVLTVRRNLEPGKGQLALPGGFINAGESWQAAGVREVEEETGLKLEAAEIAVLAVHSTPPHANNLLVFGRAAPRTASDLPAFTPNDEVSELVVITEPQPLAFPLHTQVVADFFQHLRLGAHPA